MEKLKRKNKKKIKDKRRYRKTHENILKNSTNIYFY